MAAKQIYVVQVAGRFKAVGVTYKAFELIVNAKTGRAALGIYSDRVEALSRLGKVYKL